VTIVQKRIAQVSLAKQTAKGAAASVGQYQIGVTGGAVSGATVTDQEIPMTWSGRDVEEFDRIEIIPALAFDVVAMPKTIGALLYAATGADTITGAGDPFTHTFKTGLDLPYWTLFTTHGVEKYQFTDAKLDTLELSWDRSGALMAKTSWLACALAFPASYTAGTDERPGGGLIKGAGGTFTVDGAAAIVKAGTIKIDNSLEAVMGAASVQPADVFPGEHILTVDLTIVPADMTEFRTVITGTAAGTTPQVVPYTGAAVMTFLVPGSSPAHTLTLNILAGKFAVAFPAADPKGGPQEIVLSIAAHVKSDGSAPYSFVLLNSIATY
jgi:hypothetical protein